MGTGWDACINVYVSMYVSRPEVSKQIKNTFQRIYYLQRHPCYLPHQQCVYWSHLEYHYNLSCMVTIEIDMVYN